MTHSFKLLKELLSHLTRKEIVLLKKKITWHSEQEDGRKNKSQNLISLMLNNTEITYARIEKEVYGLGNNIAFSKLIDRTIDKIDEVFINFNRDSSSFNSERNYYYFFLKRKLLVLQMRWLRGIDYELGLQFEKIIAISKKYELYDILIEALHAKQRFMGFRFGNKAFNKIEKEILRFEQYRQVVQKSRRLFTKIASRISNSNYSNQDKNELENIISELEIDYSSTNSASVGYYLFYLQVEWLQFNNKYKEAQELLENLLELLSDNPSVYTKARQCDVLTNLSSNALHLGNIKEALSTIILADNIFEKDTVPYNVVKEQEFFCRFYLREFDVAEKIILRVFNLTHKGNSPFQHSKRAYLFACVKTITGEIDKSNELLLDAKELDKNKGGWNIAKRILTIINCIESEDHERAEMQVVNLEKFCKRNAKSNHVRKRDILILRILIKLVNENYDYNKVYKSRKRYFDLLEGNEPGYAWKIKSPELIVFHEWFKKKMNS